MPMQMKRPAAAAKVASEPKAKKQQPEDPLAAKCGAVVGALSMADGLSEATLQLLEVGVRACLTVPKGERHEVQCAVVEMIGDALHGVEAGHAAKVDALRSQIGEADAEKAKRQATAEAAAAAVAEKSDVVASAEKALGEASAAVAAARSAHSAAVSEQTAGDTKLLSAGEKKMMAATVLHEHLRPLIDGTSADVDKSVKTVARAGKELGLEAQLLQSAELVLRAPPGNRGSFDSMVTQQVGEQFGKAVTELAALLANGEAGKAERASKVEGCGQQISAAASHKEERQGQLAAALEELQAAEAARASANSSVEDFGPEMERAVASAEAADALLVACKADVATFAELVEGPQAAPEAAPVEVAAPVEGASAEEVAQAADVDAA